MPQRVPEQSVIEAWSGLRLPRRCEPLARVDIGVAGRSPATPGRSRVRSKASARAAVRLIPCGHARTTNSSRVKSDPMKAVFEGRITRRQALVAIGSVGAVGIGGSMISSPAHAKELTM